MDNCRTLRLLEEAPSEDVIRLFLTEKFGEPCNGEWKTEYGVTFGVPRFNDTWTFRYDNSIIPSLFYPLYDSGAGTHGVLGGNDILRIIKEMEKKPKGSKVYDKPDSIKRLENLTLSKAQLHHLHLGRWHLCKGEKLSCVNNPFNLVLGYSDSENNFEVAFISDNDEYDIREYVHINYLVRLLLGKGYLITCANCNHFDELALKTCLGCRKVKYCSKACQITDWNKHKHICK